METLKEAFGLRVREIRKSRKLTQEKLAEMIGLDIPNISNIERGKNFITATTLERLIKALDVSPKDLFDFEHKRPRKELIKLIQDGIKNADEKKLCVLYRFMLLLDEIRS